MKEGKDALQERIDNAKKLCEYFKGEETLGVSKREKVKYLTGLAQEMSNDIDRDLYLNEVAENFEISVNSLFSELRLKKNKGGGKVNNQYKSEKYDEEKWLLKKLMDEPDLIEDVVMKIDASFFLEAEYRQIFETLVKHAGEFQQVSTLEMAVVPEVWARMSEILLMAEPEADIEVYMRDMKLRRYKNEREDLRRQLAHNELTKDSLNHLRVLNRKIRELSGRESVKLMFN